MNVFIEILASSVWPLCFLLVVLVLLHKIREEFNPIFRVVLGGVAQNAQKNSMQYAMAFMLATLASLQALADVARNLEWKYVEAACQILQPGLTAIVGFVLKPPGGLAFEVEKPQITQITQITSTPPTKPA